jgi:hypothetical protein
MTRRIVAALAALAAAGAVAAAAGPALAGTGPSAAKSTERIEIVATVPGAKAASAIATGVAIAGGTTTLGWINNSAGTGTVKAPDGTFRITTGKSEVVIGIGLKTCLETTSGNGTYKLSHGTGKFKGLTGSGTWTVTGQSVSGPNARGKCTANPTVSQEIVILHGPATIRK